MSEKQVWEVIKDYQCSDLKMVQDPAIAVWNHQQAKIDELQKRVDGALQILDEAYRKGIIEKPRAIPEAMKSLRGEHV